MIEQPGLNDQCRGSRWMGRWEWKGGALSLRVDLVIPSQSVVDQWLPLPAQRRSERTEMAVGLPQVWTAAAHSRRPPGQERFLPAMAGDGGSSPTRGSGG